MIATPENIVALFNNHANGNVEVSLDDEPEIEVIPSREPGVYFDVPDDEYNRWGPDSARSSVLSKLLNDTLTPAHIFYEMTHPKPRTPEQRIGTITHSAILEPEKFFRDYACGPKDTRRGTKAWDAAEAEALAAGKKELLKPDEWVQVARIIDSIWTRPEHAHVRNILLACPDREVTVVWIDEETGVKCRARIDALGIEAGMKADAKSTRSAALSSFEGDLVKYGYALQAALYQRACDVAGWSITDTTLVVYEKEPPFLVRNLMLTDPVMQEGETMLREALVRYAKCQEEGWHGYESSTTAVSFPDWFWRKLGPSLHDTIAGAIAANNKIGG